MATKTRSKQQGLHYAAYKAQNKQAANRKRKLEKLLKAFPNNTQIAVALKNIKYRRCTPKTPQWSHTRIYYTMLAKTFEKGPNVNVGSDKHMFSIRSRIGADTWKHS